MNISLVTSNQVHAIESRITRSGRTVSKPSKCVLITGASGFVGRHLSPFLAQRGYKVLAAARKHSGDFAGALPVQMPDLSYPADWTSLLRGVDVVIHLAGAAHRRLSNEEADRINHLATAELAAAAAAAAVSRFIFISSVAAQSGPSSPYPLDEEDTPSPQNSYGRSKLAAERAVRTSGVPFVILRPVVIAGANAKGNFATFEKIARTPMPLPFGGLQNRRSILTIESFNTAILTSLESASAVGQTFIVSDEPALSISEITTFIRQRNGKRAKTFYFPESLLRHAFFAVGLASLWERLSGSLVAESRKLRSIGWQPRRLHAIESPPIKS